MKKSKIQIEPLTTEEREKFFHFIETDNAFFNEVFEGMFSIVVSDPILTFQVADVIEENYKNLYAVFMKKVMKEKSKPNSAGCCKDI